MDPATTGCAPNRDRVNSTKVKAAGRWYSTKAEAITAFELACKRKGISPPLNYPPVLGGDSITHNDLAYYPHLTCAAGMRQGHVTVYVEARNN